MMDPHRLLADELKYELLYRGVSTISGQDEMRKALRRLLKFESEKKSLAYHLSPSKVPDPVTELRTVEAKLAEVDGLLESVSGNKSDNEYKRVETKLIHIIGRVQRVEPKDDEQSNVKSVLLASALERYSDLELRARKWKDGMKKDGNEPPKTPKGAGTSTDETQPEPEEKCEDDNESSHFSSSHLPLNTQVIIKKTQVPIRDWRLKFYGTNSGLSVNAFLEEVESLRIARNVSYEDLVRSAVDFFEGPALIWYKANRNKLTNWQSLIFALREEFEPFDYCDRLWDEIKSRTQGRDEKFGHFISVMKNYFARLPKEPSEEEKLRVLLNNIQPFYLKHLCLQEITSIDELLHYGRKLEYVKMRSEQHRPPPPRRSLLEPDLAYEPPPRSSAPPRAYDHSSRSSAPPRAFDHSPRSSAPQRVSAARTHYQPAEQPRPTAQSFPADPSRPTEVTERPSQDRNRNRTVWICWNCRRQGHSFRNCREKMNTFCHRCGKEDVKTKDCEQCRHQGN